MVLRRAHPRRCATYAPYGWNGCRDVQVWTGTKRTSRRGVRKDGNEPIATAAAGDAKVEVEFNCIGSIAPLPRSR